MTRRRSRLFACCAVLLVALVAVASRANDRVVVIPIHRSIGPTVFTDGDIRFQSIMLGHMFAEAMKREPALIVLEVDCMEAGNAREAGALRRMIQDWRQRDGCAPIAMHVIRANGPASTLVLSETDAWIHPSGEIGAAQYLYRFNYGGSPRTPTVRLYETFEQGPALTSRSAGNNKPSVVPFPSVEDGQISEMIERDLAAISGLPLDEKWRREVLFHATIVPEYALLYHPPSQKFNGFLAVRPDNGAFDIERVQVELANAGEDWIAVDSSRSTLVMNAQQAVDFGVCVDTASSVYELAQKRGIVSPDVDRLDREVEAYMGKIDEHIARLKRVAIDVHEAMETLPGAVNEFVSDPKAKKVKREGGMWIQRGTYSREKYGRARKAQRDAQSKIGLARRIMNDLEEMGVDGSSYLGTELLGREETDWLRDAGSAISGPNVTALNEAIGRGRAHRDRWKEAARRLESL